MRINHPLVPLSPWSLFLLFSKDLFYNVVPGTLDCQSLVYGNVFFLSRNTCRCEAW
jgi:hypothetical protein